MSSYKELVLQRDALEQQIAAARHRETAEVIAKVRGFVADFDLTVDDVFPAGKVRTGSRPGVKNPTGKVAPKYRNPATGDTWTGRGKAPRWIQDKDRSAFLIVV
jgi:DNA-binding protein H-NS